MATYLTQDDVQNFGSELVDLSQRAAMHAVAPHLQELERQNAELHDRLARQAKHNIDQALDSAVPNWRQVNQHPSWLAWLQERDVYSREKRQHLLDQAVEKGDANRVIAFFNGFLAEAAWQQGAATQQSARQAAQPSGRIYTRPQITEMARRRQKGLIDDEAWRRWEYELCRASKEGRVRGALSLETGLPTTL